MKSQKNVLLVAIALIVVAVLLYWRWPLRCGVPRAGGAAPVAQPAFDLDAYLAQVAARDPAQGFDAAAHAEALKQVGPPHQDALQARAAALAAQREREHELLEANAAGAALTNEIAAIRARIAALRAAAAPVEVGAKPAATATAELEGTLAAQEAALQEFFASDATWRARHDALTAAEARRRAAYVRLQAVIRARFQAERRLAMATKDAAGDTESVSSVSVSNAVARPVATEPSDQLKEAQP